MSRVTATFSSVLRPRSSRRSKKTVWLFESSSRLISIGDGKRSAEENALLSLLAALVEQFERRAYPVPSAEPKDILRDLMESNELKSADLADVMGGRSRVSEVLSGKRAISKEQAKRLGERFRISPAAFI